MSATPDVDLSRPEVDLDELTVPGVLSAERGDLGVWIVRKNGTRALVLDEDAELPSQMGLLS